MRKRKRKRVRISPTRDRVRVAWTAGRVRLTRLILVNCFISIVSKLSAAN